ncbi:gamma subclass chorismate mutase AroQ [Nocardia sp. CDC159]|uniref:chorismate mutase n=1 Tax=Nocardia pulmonis TaxID=2951408 RepID=A0A9X2EEY1_9NOCA|nr:MULTISPECIES: gamma subclass chorismate mutase AroQ [Nocardia]MCM6776926.1 gamma subclass chorismate mutase AroQ [Nocardia pulmonis]MCM6789350.1 gamma subclass chorismate mutase AroQ [Nocardia sp. CDC159]
MRGSALVLAAAVAFGVLVGEAPTVTAQPVPPAVAAADRPLDRVVELALERLETGDTVAAAKWVSAAASGVEPVIDDPVREAQVYDAMVEAGAKLGLPGDWVRQVFSGQIEANKMVQRGLLARWRFDPAAAPTSAPNLLAVRPIIDRVNGEILAQLAAHRAELSGPHCAERLATSVFPALTSGRTDALHQAALVRAGAALCSPS